MMDELKEIADERLRKVISFVEEELSDPIHGIDHVMRVYRLCLELAKHEEGVNMEVLTLAALLHDIAREREFETTTGEVDHAALGAEVAEEVLRELGYPEETVEEVKHCIIAHRFRSQVKPRTIEAKILSDADKLDVIGAIGIARCFMLAGRMGQRIWSDVPLEEYVRENIVIGRIKEWDKHAPNLEFELKLKHIPDVLYTERAKEIARKRMEFMEEFFRRLKEELEGRA